MSDESEAPIPTGREPVRVLVVDDQELFRRGLTMLLAVEPGIEVVGEVGDGVEGTALAESAAPDVVLLDVRMPKRSGIEACLAIKESVPSAKIIMLTVSDEEADLYKAVKSGASGYLLKEEIQPSLIDKIIATHNGHAPLSPAVSRLVLDKLESLETGVKPKVDKAQKLKELGLGQREWSVLNLLIEGLPIVDIGNRLSISRFTVNQHLRSIYRKLNVNSRAMATSVARMHGLVDD